jgi:hypothetical protein
MPRSNKLLSFLATAAAATAVTACAGARTAAPRAQAPRAPVLTAVVLAPAVAPTPDTPTPVAEGTPLEASIIPDGPLVGDNGRPACGNVQTKSQNSMSDCK